MKIPHGLTTNIDSTRRRAARPLRLLRRAADFMRGWQPLTARGLIVVLLSAAALRFLYLPEADLIAAMLGGGLLALGALVVVSAWLLRYRLGRQLQIEARFDRTDPRAKSEIASGLILSNSSVAPFFSLSLTRCFDHPGVFSKAHVVRGKEPELGKKRHLVDAVVFPHRGLWTLTAHRAAIGDNFGLVSLVWDIPDRTSIEVSPPLVSIKPLPIVAASSRSGDQISFSRERSGDLFDIKAYDPSDGVKRILWKSFARSGQLVVRRPEPAVVPEGEVALYLIADKTQDYVAAAMLDYVDTLNEQNIGTLFGTDGLLLASLPAAGGLAAGERICTTIEEISHAVNRSVWSAHAGTGRDFEAFLDQLQNSARQIHNVIAFAPAPDVKSGGAGAAVPENLWFSRLAKLAAQRSLKLNIALVPASVEMPLAGSAFAAAADRRLGLERLKPLLSATKIVDRVRGRHGEAAGAAANAQRRQLAVSIAQSGAEVLMVEPYELSY